MNVPKLRFKEFTGEWEACNLVDFTFPIKRKNRKNESDLPLTISSLDGLVDQRDYFNRVVASKDMSNYYLLFNGEFAYNKSYSVGFPLGSIKRLDKYEKGVLSTLYICFAIKEECVDSDYATYYFDSDKWHKEVSLCVAEGARNHGLLNVSNEEFYKTKHFIPIKNEQTKISTFLKYVYEKIGNQQAIVESLEKQKKALMQKIFSQELRFKDENGEEFPAWEETSCDINIVAGNAYPLTSYSIDGTLLIQGVNVYPGKLMFDNIIRIDDGYKGDNHIEIQKNDILLGLNRPIVNGEVKVCLADIGEKAYLYQRAGVLRFDKKEIYYAFLYQYLRSAEFKKRLTNELVGSDQPYIKSNLFNVVRPLIPCFREQEKIAMFFTKFDEKIEVEVKRLEHWRRIKQGLLQQMFV